MRALLIVLDPLGVGLSSESLALPAPHTLDQLFASVDDLELPTLFSLGLGEIMKGRVFAPPARSCKGSYGGMIQRSAGADALSGLWELAGVALGCPFAAFERIPDELVQSIARESGVEFLIGPPNQPAASLRQEHLRTGRPILTFSADALHIDAHQSTLTPSRLAHICRIARQHGDVWRVARIVGRSFTGDSEAWQPSREVCLSLVPPRTILNAISEKGLPVEAIGDLNDVFARSGITRAHPTASHVESFEVIEQLWSSSQNGLVFAHLGNLAAAPGSPSLNNPAAVMARALERFDRWLCRFLDEIESDNLLLITGSNAARCAFGDPVHHPRQEVPVLVRYGGHTGPLGLRDSLADVAATLGAFFGIDEPSRRWVIGEPLLTFPRPRGFSGP